MKYKNMLILMLFVFISGSRDAIAEVFMKSVLYVSPATIVWFFSFAAFAVAPFVWAIERKEKTLPLKTLLEPKILVRFFLLNVTTSMTYGLTIYAIWSNLGAAYTSFLDYALTSTVASFIAWKFFHESLPKRYLVTITLAIAGLTVLALNSDTQSSSDFPAQTSGILAVILAAGSGASMYAINKQLVSLKIPTWSIISGRMPLTFALATVYLVQSNTLSELKDFSLLAPYSMLCYGLPMYLILVVFKSASFSNFTLYLFLVPVVTLLSSLTLGVGQFSMANIIGVMLVFIPVAVYQFLETKSESKG